MVQVSPKGNKARLPLLRGVRVARLDKLRSCRHRAGGKELSTGQFHLDGSSLAIGNKTPHSPLCGGVGFWSEWRDSNSRHPGPKPGALPTGPHPEIKMYYTRYLGKKQVPIWASILSEGKCQPPTGWLGAGMAIGWEFRQSPGPAWLRPPSGNRRCWHRLHSCLPCRTAWRRHPGCGRC